jgi:hypothetical protein
MMRLILFFAAAVGLSAQYAAILGSDYPANSLTQLNRKLASRVGSGAPSGACTAGLDLYLDSAVPAVYICPAGTWVLYAPGSGTVSTVSVATANGVSGTVANPTTTPAITISLGAITPTSVAASGNVTGANLSGTNTGDQTNITGNAGTASAFQTPRNINGVAFDGTANITITASLPSNPAACPGGEYVTDIAADGTLTCAAVSGGAHTQNTDSGTTQTSFQIDSTNTGPRIKNNAGTMEVRNAADSALAPLAASNLSGTNTGDQTLYNQTIRLNSGSNVSQRGRINFVDGAGIAWTTVDSSGNDETQIIATVDPSYVTLSGTQTLENKTFVAPALGTPASGVATNLTGTAAGLTAGAATALAANPANCSAGSLPRGVAASGAAEGCAAVDLAAEVTGTLPPANGGRVNRQITLVATDVSSTGTKSCSVVEVAGTIVAAHLISNALPTGSNLVVDVLKVGFSSYTGPASASSITASAVPTIATGDSNPRYEDTTLTGWTTSIAANDVVCVAISTAPSGGATWASVALEVQ